MKLPFQLQEKAQALLFGTATPDPEFMKFEIDKILNAQLVTSTIPPTSVATAEVTTPASSGSGPIIAIVILVLIIIAGSGAYFAYRTFQKKRDLAAGRSENRKLLSSSSHEELNKNKSGKSATTVSGGSVREKAELSVSQVNESWSNRICLHDPQAIPRSKKRRPHESKMNILNISIKHRERDTEKMVEQSKQSRYPNPVQNNNSNIPYIWRRRLKQPQASVIGIQEQLQHQYMQVEQEYESQMSPRENKQLHQCRSMPPQSSFQNYNTTQPGTDPAAVDDYFRRLQMRSPFNNKPNLTNTMQYGSYQYGSPQNSYFNNSHQQFTPPGHNYNQNAQTFISSPYNYMNDHTCGQGSDKSMNYTSGSGLNHRHYKSFIPVSILTQPAQSTGDNEHLTNLTRSVFKYPAHRITTQPVIEAPENSSISAASRSSSGSDLANESRSGALTVPYVARTNPGTYYCFQDPELKPGQYAIYYQDVSD